MFDHLAGVLLYVTRTKKCAFLPCFLWTDSGESVLSVSDFALQSP